LAQANLLVTPVATLPALLVHCLHLVQHLS
jgi:hypothetical protein